MYLCKLKLFVVSKSEEPERIFRSVALPEDCEIEITTVKELDRAALSLCDCGVISDGDAALLGGIKDAKRVLIAEGSRLNDMTAEELEAADDIFAMPDGGIYDEKLLAAHFRRLVNTMKNEFDFRREKKYFETAIDSIPDLVWFKDREGAHLIVNDSFCKLVEKTKEQIYKRGHYYIWDIPREEYEKGEYVCLESEDEVIEARKTCIFDEKIKTKGGMRQFKTYKSPLIDVDGSIFGTCGVAHDVTDLHNMNNELDVILESVPFAVIVYDTNNIIVNANKEFNLMFGIHEELTKVSVKEWMDSYVVGRVKRVPNRSEFMLDYGNEVRTISFSQQNITDIFGEAIGSMVILRDVTVERLNEARTIKNANTDFLTGLNNRRSLTEHLENVKKSPRIALITIDLDNFKQVNDDYGHQKGDDALQTVTRVMKEQFPEDFLVRLGGDEFLIVISREADVEQIREEVALFQSILRAEYLKTPEFIKITTSIGIATEALSDCGRYDFDKLIRHSDRALYKAKDNGKAQFFVYES